MVRVAQLLSQRTFVPNVKCKYFKIAELLNIALFVRVTELLFQKRYVQNVKLKYFNMG